MLRTGLLIFATLLLVIGALLCITGVAWGGIQSLVTGAVILVGTVFERWRYNNRNASSKGDWQRTGERFVDPASGKEVEVLYDSRSGERRYQEMDGN